MTGVEEALGADVMIEVFLRSVPLFAGLPDAELQILAQTSRLLALPAQSILGREGEQADQCYLVIDGSLEVIKAYGTPDERLIAVHGPTELAGEISIFLPEEVLSATLRTQTPARLLALRHADFDALLHRRPFVAYELARVLSRHVRDTHVTTLHDLREKNRELTEAYQHLRAHHAQLVAKEALERELLVAREIQLSLLPRRFPAFPGYDVAALTRPAHAVGGDFFDVLVLDDHRLGLVIGDVSEKGVPAALFMVLTCTLLRAGAGHAASPQAALLEVNRHLRLQNDAGMFVTIWYGVLDRVRQRLCSVRAGHELPIVLDADGEELPVAMGSSEPLGISDGPVLDEQLLLLPSGSRLLLYTDGVTDAQDGTGAFFERASVRAALKATAGVSAQETCDHLLQAIAGHQGAAPQFDDMTIVAVHALERSCP